MLSFDPASHGSIIIVIIMLLHIFVRRGIFATRMHLFPYYYYIQAEFPRWIAPPATVSQRLDRMKLMRIAPGSHMDRTWIAPGSRPWSPPPSAPTSPKNPRPSVMNPQAHEKNPAGQSPAKSKHH